MKIRNVVKKLHFNLKMIRNQMYSNVQFQTVMFKVFKKTVVLNLRMKN